MDPVFEEIRPWGHACHYFAYKKLEMNRLKIELEVCDDPKEREIIQDCLRPIEDHMNKKVAEVKEKEKCVAKLVIKNAAGELKTIYKFTEKTDNKKVLEMLNTLPNILDQFDEEEIGLWSNIEEQKDIELPTQTDLSWLPEYVFPHEGALSQLPLLL